MNLPKLCRHIMPTGCTCKSPAMRGKAYCYYHGPEKRARRSHQPTESKFELAPISEPACIPGAIHQILQALASNQISTARASIMLQGLQTILATWKIPPIDLSDIPDLADDFDLGNLGSLIPPPQNLP